MVNILNIDSEYFIVNDFKGCKMVQYYLIYVFLMKMVFHTFFLRILNASLKNLEHIII